MKCPQVRADGQYPAGRVAEGTFLPCPACGKQVKAAFFRRSEGLVAFVPSHVSAGTERSPAPERTATASTGPTTPVLTPAYQGRSRRDPPAVRPHEWVDPDPTDRCGQGRAHASEGFHGFGSTIFALCRRCGDCWDCADVPPCPGNRVRTSLADRPPIGTGTPDLVEA